LRRVDEGEGLRIGGSALFGLQEPCFDHDVGSLLGRAVRAAADEDEPWRILTFGCVAKGVVDGDVYPLPFLDAPGVEQVRAKAPGLSEALARGLGRWVETHPD